MPRHKANRERQIAKNESAEFMQPYKILKKLGSNIREGDPQNDQLRNWIFRMNSQ